MMSTLHWPTRLTRLHCASSQEKNSLQIDMSLRSSTIASIIHIIFSDLVYVNLAISGVQTHNFRGVRHWLQTRTATTVPYNIGILASPLRIYNQGEGVSMLKIRKDNVYDWSDCAWSERHVWPFSFAISAEHHESYEFEPRWWRGLHRTLCDKNSLNIPKGQSDMKKNRQYNDQKKKYKRTNSDGFKLSTFVVIGTDCKRERLRRSPITLVFLHLR
jgi:hypothetical protein